MAFLRRLAFFFTCRFRPLPRWVFFARREGVCRRRLPAVILFSLDRKKYAKKVKGYVRFATPRLSFAKSPELAPYRSSNSVAFSRSLSAGLLNAHRPRPGGPYEAADVTPCGKQQGNRYTKQRGLPGVRYVPFSLCSLTEARGPYEVAGFIQLGKKPNNCYTKQRGFSCVRSIPFSLRSLTEARGPIRSGRCFPTRGGNDCSNPMAGESSSF